jgi:peptidoglycan-associated lipoprotein
MPTFSRRSKALALAITVAVAIVAACAKKQPPVNNPPPAPPPAVGTTGTKPSPPAPPPAPPTVPAEPDPISGKPYGSYSVDDWNNPEKSPLKPVFFHFDSDQLDDLGRQVLQENAKLLQEYPALVITIEGHCDERGTPEYNLALGERRALSTKSFLVSLGIGGDRLQTVSYGKEFPFDTGHSEEAWAKNRRAHFMVTKLK